VNFRPEPYQQRMIDFMVDHERAAMFVSPGLGKTAATLEALRRLMADGAVQSALVVAPLRVARLTWPNEIAKWDEFRWMKVEHFQGQKPSGKAHIYLINYERLQNLESLTFCQAVVFDELTRAKNHQSKRIKHLAKLFGEQRRIGLTGTPRPNSLLELFAQIRLLDDGKRLGRSFDNFKRNWFLPTDYMEYNWVPREGTEEAVYRKIEDLQLTLRASDYSDVADTVVEDIEVPLPPEAQSAYKELEKQLLIRVREGDVVAVNAAVLVNKLLQITGGSAYTDEREVAYLHGAKIEALKKILKDTRENVIVACNYIHERERICRETGAVNASEFRGDIEQAWNEGRIKVLVADPRSLGHGLNLQKGGRTIVWFSPTWSRELYDQFNARVARKGQGEVPLVYRLICPGTIDDAVIETLRQRGDSQTEMLAILHNLQSMRK
jgi:SNF2 family DNA or RNA helicase